MSKALRPSNFREMEEVLNDRVDVKTKVLAIAERLMPLLEGDAKVGDVIGMLKRSAPVAMFSLIDVMLTAKSDSVRSRAATEILYMAGHKPVEKSVNLTDAIDKMAPAQLDAFLSNALTNLSIKDRETVIQLVQNINGEFAPVPEGQLPEVTPADIPEEQF